MKLLPWQIFILEMGKVYRLICSSHRIYPLLCCPLIEELDSYMYQSVGHDVIEAYSECMGLSLYRRVINGQPKNLNYDYVPTDSDEVEDLYELIRQVKEAHPDLEAVSSGAIFSSYQKNRVENMYCIFLG